VVVTEAFPGNSFAVSLQHLREVNYYVNDGDGNVVALFRVYPLWKGTKDYGKELFLQSLMVRNGYRHLGIGNHLLEVVRVLAKRRKLLCQADDNVVRFYEKNHFEATPASTLVSDKHCTAWSQCSMGVPGTFRVTAPGTIGFSYTMQLMHWYITVAVYAPDDSMSLRTPDIILCVLTRVLSNWLACDGQISRVARTATMTQSPWYVCASAMGISDSVRAVMQVYSTAKKVITCLSSWSISPSTRKYADNMRMNHRAGPWRNIIGKLYDSAS
jgi:GNAT superfamily N-acetyltransferase